MIGKYPKCCIIQNKNENCDEETQIKQNKRKLWYSEAFNNGTDHHHSKSCCDQRSPARRTKTLSCCLQTLLYTNCNNCIGGETILFSLEFRSLGYTNMQHAKISVYQRFIVAHSMYSYLCCIVALNRWNMTWNCTPRNLSVNKPYTDYVNKGAH